MTIHRLLALATASAAALLLPATIGQAATAATAGSGPAAGSASSADHSARRVAPTCQGERATVVGHKGKRIVGTKGRDVIVTNGSTKVHAKGGSDLICVSGGRDVKLVAGGGDDRIDVQQRKGDVTAVLGAGADTYDGSRVRDHVGAAGAQRTRTKDRDKDVIRTRGGDDEVVTGDMGAANADVIDLGPGDDRLWSQGFANRRAVLRAGSGEDEYALTFPLRADPAAAWVVDNAAGTITDRGRTVARRVHDFEFFDLRFLAGASQHFIGSDADETVYLNRDTSVSAAMGAGDDAVHVWLADALAVSTLGIDGGAGRDEIGFPETWGPVVGDLGSQSATIARVGQTIQFDGFEDMHVSSVNAGVTITGDDGPNRLSGTACGLVINGEGGDDVLLASQPLGWVACDKPASLHGGEGNDELTGGTYDDHLDGGPGTDSADGAEGTDVCLAERWVRCEG